MAARSGAAAGSRRSTERVPQVRKASVLFVCKVSLSQIGAWPRLCRQQRCRANTNLAPFHWAKVDCSKAGAFNHRTLDSEALMSGVEIDQRSYEMPPREGI